MAVIQSQRFYEYKTVTQTSIIMEDNPRFPAVSICNFNLIKNESVTDFMTQILLKTMFLDDQWNTEEQRRLQLEEVDGDFLRCIGYLSFTKDHTKLDLLQILALVLPLNFLNY